jgi:hypothetical protein
MVDCGVIVFNSLTNFYFLLSLLFLWSVQREDGGFDSGVDEEKNKCVSPPPPDKSSANGTTGAVAKKAKTSGVFKGDGKKLSDAEQDKEVALLNPKRPSVPAGRNLRESSVAQVSKAGTAAEDTCKNEDDIEEGRASEFGRIYSNFSPMYMLYQFEDADAEECCCVIVNLPSGVAAGGLRGKINTKVDSSMQRLLITVEWPESLTCVDSLQDALVESLMDKFGNQRATSMLHHIVLGHKKEVKKIRASTGIDKSQYFSSKTVINLPFKCISQPVTTKTVNCGRTEAYNIYMVFKKWKKPSEDNSMDFEVHRSSAGVGLGREILPIMQSRAPKYTLEDLQRMTYYNSGGTTVASTQNRTYIETDSATVTSAVTEF